MDERALREMIDDVVAGRLSRRAFVAAMLTAGLTGPLIAQLVPDDRIQSRPWTRASCPRHVWPP